MSKEHTQPGIVFPDQLAGLVDLARVTRELSALNESLHQASIRTPGNSVQLPKTSKILEELASLNKVSLLDQTQREQLIQLLESIKAHAPVVHIAFASEPSTAFVKKITGWMRNNVSPITLVDIGLQPTITAGCTLRTTNKVFDMSLRHRFAETREILVKKLSEVQS